MKPIPRKDPLMPKEISQWFNYNGHLTVFDVWFGHNDRDIPIGIKELL